jgi:hypothetical protein
VLYARVFSPEHKENLERQVERLMKYCVLRGYETRTGGLGKNLRRERQPPVTIGAAPASSRALALLLSTKAV